jgi:hypothetical protein
MAAQAWAQRPDFTFCGEGLAVLAREGSRDSKEHGQGTLLGGGGQFRLKHFSLAVHGLLGKLSSDSVANAEHNLRVTQVAIRIHPAHWLAAGVQFEAQRSTHKDTVTAWQLYGATIGLTGSLGVEGLTGRLEGAWYPIRRSNSTDPLSPRLRRANYLEAGLEFALIRTGIDARLSYRVEIYYFDQAEAIRRGGLLLGFGARLRRQS